ncbi:MAG: hypothetical protein AB7K09_24040 [Planctomycetota bacterium]
MNPTNRTGKIRVRQDLLDRAGTAATAAGFSSVEEFVEHAIEQALGRAAASGAVSEAEREEIERRLGGMGYV